MTLGLFKSSKMYVATLMMLGLLVHTPSVVANMERQESPIEKLNEQRAEKQEEAVSNKTQHTRPYIQLRWDKVMSQTPCWMFLKYREDARDYLSRVKKRIKTFLSVFEDAYGVRVVWEHDLHSLPDMTKEFINFVHLFQAVEEMSVDTETLQRVMQLYKRKVSDEQVINTAHQKHLQGQSLYGDGIRPSDGSYINLNFKWLAPKKETQPVYRSENQPYTLVSWDTVMPQANTWIRSWSFEKAADYLWRITEEINTLLSAFEDVYGTRVIWEDVADKYPDMTREFSSFAILVQGLKRTLSDEKALQKVTPLLLKEKNSTERGKFQ